MRHRIKGRKLGRNPTHRTAMKRNMAQALFEHERIITTIAKAKELRPFVERLITLGKRNTLHSHRLVASRLGSQALTRKLFDEIAPRFSDRPGGYTRIIKRAKPRLGDAAPTAILELVSEEMPSREPSAPEVELPTKPEVEQPEAKESSE